MSFHVNPFEMFVLRTFSHDKLFFRLKKKGRTMMGTKEKNVVEIARAVRRYKN